MESKPTHDTKFAVNIVRIPYDGSRLTLAPDTPLTIANPGGICIEECNEEEKWLTCFPQISSCDNFAQTFHWDYRSLIGISAKDLG